MLRQAAVQTYSALRKLGVESGFSATPWRRRRLLILCWHGIALEDEHQWCGGLYITQELFRSRLRALEQGKYNVLPLHEGLERLRRGDLPPRSVAITFDDGLYDFLALAAPVLEEFGFPATVYLTTYYVNRQLPVPNLTLSYLLWKGKGPGRKLAGGLSVTNDREAAAAHATLVERADRDGASAADRDAMARSVAAQFDIDYDQLLHRRILHLLTGDEVSQLSRSGKITFEGHTHRHRTPLDPNLMLRELVDNNSHIERLTGRKPVHFCYPSGVFREEYFSLFRQVGYKSATTCLPGFGSAGTNPYLMPRLLDHMGLADWQYQGWLSGLLGLKSRA